jgi:3-methyladenine DNA glycosylase AlkC
VENPAAFKHALGKALLVRQAAAIKAVYPEFAQSQFVKLADELEGLELKSRVRRIRDELHRFLPPSYPQALKILLASTKSGKLSGFDLWPYSDFIQTFGLDHVDLSLKALRQMTSLFSSEFAIRPFLLKHPAITLKFLKQSMTDSSMDIRRWTSEGSRPRLPWGEKLGPFIHDPSPTLPILESLKYDAELYVRKSVSNHLNDIAKDHPQRVLELLKRWQK